MDDTNPTNLATTETHDPCLSIPMQGPDGPMARRALAARTAGNATPDNFIDPDDEDVDAEYDFEDEILPFEITHARCDPSHCLAPRLFKPLKRGQRKREKLHVIYEFGEGRRMEFMGFEPLGADDLRVLQALVALAGPTGRPLFPGPKTKREKYLRQNLQTKGDAIHEPAIMIETTLDEIARVMGCSERCGRIHDLIRESLKRLWAVSIIAEAPDSQGGFRILSYFQVKKYEGRVHVALNPMIADAIVGRSRYTRIQMAEVRMLKSEAARLIHSRLCAWINPGTRRKVALNTLYTYLWPDDDAKTNTRKKRRQRLRNSLKEIEVAGWTTEEVAQGVFLITRPSC